MRIGIDISQTAHDRTGVANFVIELVSHLAAIDKKNDYILFFSSLRKKPPQKLVTLTQTSKNIHLKRFTFPPTLLDILWNTLHVLPVEILVGKLDVFISSDWVQPPTRAKSITILYDLIVYKYPDETDKKIVTTQKKRLAWVKKECDTILCISESTKNDARELLDIDEHKLAVIYPGVTV
jgi:glycosyltransferase involved in cell wall biosynthesis